MDAGIQKALHDRLYDRRKGGALELETLVKDCLLNEDHDRIEKIVHQLCQDYAYAVHQPHARNGGLIGLAAASIALGPEVARYLEEIVPPVLACFTDQDARVRYYACESMYNIAKVAKGEILMYFNEVFDALSKLSADSEMSVKNGAELLDRLVKDIVSESAANYVSVLQNTEDAVVNETESGGLEISESAEVPTAFSLAKFIPLLQERINVTNPFTRTFLVTWITLLDSIPDLELVAYLPFFLGGLFKFLSDPNQDVHTITQGALERFLTEIKRISAIQRRIGEGRRSGGENGLRRSNSSIKSERSAISRPGDTDSVDRERGPALDDGSGDALSDAGIDEKSGEIDGDYIPGQDVQVDHSRILDTLVSFLGESHEEEIQVTALRWIDSFFEICPEKILTFVPRLLSRVLQALSNDVEQVRLAASRVNTSLTEYIVTLPDEKTKSDRPLSQSSALTHATNASRDHAIERRDSEGLRKLSKMTTRDTLPERPSAGAPATEGVAPPAYTEEVHQTPPKVPNLDYEAAVSALTLQFLNEHEATRVAALAWLIMLHRKAPRKILAIDDGTFPALLKTLSDPSESVVTRDLILLSQISKNSDDSYFTSFMVNLLKLFFTDRRLLETRGNLIIRQLCVSLSAERIYRVMADCLEKDEDVEFASIMVQMLNNNLITAPELAELRKRLRTLATQDGQSLFVALFRAWCHNAVATFSLCLLAQAYEQAYNLLQIFGELEMTVNMLIQIDKLVQLLESPVFTCKYLPYLRLQLLEPERYPHLYKCLYGLLMLLPQSSAFAALKNRLNSVSAIGYLHIAPRSATYSYGPISYIPLSSPPGKRTFAESSRFWRSASSGPSTPVGTTNASSGSVASSLDRQNRTRSSRDDPNTTVANSGGPVRWVELVDKFKFVQERSRRTLRAQQLQQQQERTGSPALYVDDPDGGLSSPMTPGGIDGASGTQSAGPRLQLDSSNLTAAAAQHGRGGTGYPAGVAAGNSKSGPGAGGQLQPTSSAPHHKSKSSFSNLTKFAGSRKSKK